MCSTELKQQLQEEYIANELHGLSPDTIIIIINKWLKQKRDELQELAYGVDAIDILLEGLK